MDYSEPFLGRNVYVKIDRTVGSKHPKFGYVYPINYGFVPGTEAPDGAELDVYVLGENEPLTDYRGKCIAIVHRTDDDDDKLIVCAENQNFTDEQIAELTKFQEQWFESKIIRANVSSL